MRLVLILGRLSGVVCSGFSWLSIGTSGVLLWIQMMNLWFLAPRV